MEQNKRKVLLVEDNEQNAYLARFLLEEAGLLVVHAETAAAALEMASRDQHDIILLDIQLPDADGYQVAAKLRQDEKYRTAPIIAVSSFAMPNERERAYEAGCNGYIEKPIAPSTFVEQVCSFLTAA